PTGGLLDRGANLTIFNLTNYTVQPLDVPPTLDTNGAPVAADANGRLALGENSGTKAGFTNNDVWTIAPNGAGTQRRFSDVPFTNLALLVIRIEHNNDGDEHTVSIQDTD